MRRRLLNLLTLLSLLMCVAAVVMWWRSYRVLETYIFQPGACGYSFGSSHGAVLLKAVWDQGPGSERWRYYADSARTGYYVMARTSRRYPGGFWWESGRTHGEYPYASLILPYWSLAAAAAALPMLWLALRRRRRVADAPGLCASCGYDLRATPRRCPECGEPARARGV